MSYCRWYKNKLFVYPCICVYFKKNNAFSCTKTLAPLSGVLAPASGNPWRHHCSSGTCKDKTRIFRWFVFCSALGSCLDYVLMLMIKTFLMLQALLHPFVLPFLLSLCLYSRVNQAFQFGTHEASSREDMSLRVIPETNFLW